MRFVGQSEIADFLATSPRHAEAIRAWRAEIKYGRWSSAGDLVASFRSADVSSLPTVIFNLAPDPVRIETLIDFGMNIVLLVAIAPYTASYFSLQRAWNIAREH